MYKILYSLLLLFSLFLLARNLSANQVVVLACEDNEDFPFVMGRGKDLPVERPGVVIELLNIVAQELGLKFEYRRFPWKRAIEFELNNGSVNGLFPVSYAPERLQYGVYPHVDGQPDADRRIFTIQYNFYKNKNSQIVWDGVRLLHFQGVVGAPRGYSIVKDLQAMGYTVEESGGCLQDLRKLAADRVQIVAALETQADNVLARHPELAAVIEKIEKPIIIKDYHLLFSWQFYKQNQELCRKIWEKTGELREIFLPELLEKY